MPKSRCEVSIVVPMYNAERFIGECIDSVIAQSCPTFELLIVDDGSSDDSVEIVEAYARRDGRVRLLRHPDGANLGVSRTRRLGISAASGEFLAFLDADDAFEPTKLARQLELMESHPDCVLCHTGIRSILDPPDDPERVPLLESYAKQVVDHVNRFSSEMTEYRFLERPQALRSNHVCNSSAMVRASAIRETVVATRQLFQFEDFAQWVLLSVKGPFLFLPEPLTRYRVHGMSSTSYLLANPLKQLYSQIECLLVILAQTDDPSLKDLAEAELLESLSRTMDLYSDRAPGGLSKRSDVASPSPGVTAEALREHRVRYLEAQVSKLEAERQSLSGQLEVIRNSRTYRLIRAVSKAIRSPKLPPRWPYRLTDGVDNPISQPVQGRR